MGNGTVAVGFNTSLNCRQSPNTTVKGVLRVLVFDLNGTMKASRNLPYLADGYGELVADGEGLPGPGGTLLIRIQSVNLDPEGTHESKSGVLLLDASLNDVIRMDNFLEQTTLLDHALVFQDGFTLTGPRTYSVLDGVPPKELSRRQVEWPTGTMDHKFGEHGFAFMLCSQELSPGTYTSTNVAHQATKFRCSVNTLDEDGSNWTFGLQDGETAALVGLLADGSVVGQVHMRATNTERLVEWGKDGRSSMLPWLPAGYDGSVNSATRDFSRYATLATHSQQPCDALAGVLTNACNEGRHGRWFVFDTKTHSALVDRTFPKNGRAALSPDGLHYASFESDELRIYSLPVPR